MIYGIFHCYEVDGGFGDAVLMEDLLFVTDSEEIAKAYVEKWSHPYIYDRPYSYLTCGELRYGQLEQLYTGEIDQSPMDILGIPEALHVNHKWSKCDKAEEWCDLDLWRVENRPDDWNDHEKWQRR